MLSKQFQGGRDLSGGQWQRISVARGLYRWAPVVVVEQGGVDLAGEVALEAADDLGLGHALGGAAGA